MALIVTHLSRPLQLKFISAALTAHGMRIKLEVTGLMKKILLGCSLLFLLALVFPEGAGPEGEYILVERRPAGATTVASGIGDISFESRSFTLELDAKKQVFACRSITNSGLTYLQFGQKPDTAWLLLYSPGYILIYEHTGRLIYQGLREFTPQDSFELVPLEYEATSFLTENGTSYAPSNLGVYTETDKPWANSGGTYAAGQAITLTAAHDFNKLIISNGYISFAKPELYLKNSRLKRITVFDAARNRKLLDAELKDTPLLQEIELGAEVRKVTIKINDVYKGTRYKDTCINFILAEYRDPNPYLGPQGMDVTQ
jgi:hypothetical protein